MISEVDSMKMGNVIGKKDFKRWFWIFISSEFCQEREKLSILKVHCMCATKKEGEMISEEREKLSILKVHCMCATEKEGEMISGVEIPHIGNSNSIRFC